MHTLEEIRSSIVRFRGSWQDDTPDDLIGLPLEDLFLRLKIEKREAQERGERARAERLKREADARVAKIEETAMWKSATWKRGWPRRYRTRRENTSRIGPRKRRKREKGAGSYLENA